MKNKIIYFLIFFLIVAGFNISFASEEFNFDVTEVEITEDGNKFKGSKKGTATTQDGLIITADNFEYDKILNILYSYNNVKFDDVNQKIRIQSDKIRDGTIYEFNFSARSFLHNQVRSIVGCLEKVGCGKWDPQKIQEILLSKDRSRCAALAPPGGLYLTKVEY